MVLVANSRRPLRINVGFIVNQEVGYNHRFDFEFQKLRVSDDLELRDFYGQAEVGRTPQGLIVNATFTACLDLECVRCLSTFESALDFEITELYAFSRRSITDSGLLLPEDAHIDLQPLVRDYALLEEPIKPICKPDCKGLCPVCGEDLNQTDCGHSNQSGDSPFSTLKDLLNQ